MSEEIELGIRLKADGSGLVGEVRIADKELKKLGGAAKGTSKDMGTLSRGSDLAREKLKGLRNQGQQLHSTLFSLKGLLATVGVGALAKSFINAASTAEQYRVRLKILLGDMTEGNRLFQQMAVFAGKVPFEYREIMAAATALAGVLSGGVDEISAWMPLIGDLAAASGLGIQQTTDQVIRMMSAGAASADLFRERGILAMLGFQAGVTYSGNQTRDQLVAAWADVSSKFRGATEELASTWDGKMSMLSDKWFAFRNQVMDAGLFDYLKNLAGTLDNNVGKAMDNNKDKAKEWSDVAISGIENVIRALDVMLQAWNKILVGLKTLQLGFEAIKFSALSAQANVSEKIDAANNSPELNTAMNLSPMGATFRFVKKLFSNTSTNELRTKSDSSAARLDQLRGELDTLIGTEGGFDAEAKIQSLRDSLVQTASNAKVSADNVEELNAQVAALNNTKSASNELTKEEQKSIEANQKFAERAIKDLKKEADARKKALQDRVSDLSESLLDETELENKRYKESVALLKKAEEQKLATTMSYAELRQRVEDDHQQNLKAIRDEATREAREKLEDEAERQAEIIQEPFKNALRGIQDGFTDFYEDLFSGGVDSFSDLASSAKKIFIRLAAEIATLMTIRPVISGVLGSVGLSGIASSLGFGGSTSTASVGGVGGVAGGAAAGGGFSLGSLSSLSGLISGLSSPGLATFGFNAAQSLGLSTGASSSVASALGFAPAGALGGFAASLFGLGGGVGGTIGGIGGTLAGGALGGSLLTGLGTAGGPVGAAIGGFLGTALGGLFGGGDPHYGGSADVILNSGRTLRHGSAPESSASIAQAIQSSLSKFADAVGGSLSRGSISIGDLSNASDYGVQRFSAASSLINLPYTSNGQGVPQQIRGDDAEAFAKNVLSALIKSGRAITGVDSDIASVIRKSAAQNRGDLDKIIDDVNFARSMLDDVTDSASSALEQINEQFSEMRDRATRLGLPLAKINEAIGKAADEALGISRLNAFRDSLNSSGLSAREQLNAVVKQFEDSSNLALGGDQNAINNFPAVAQQVLGLGRQVYASGAGYQNLFESVNNTLSRIIVKQEDLRSSLGGDIGITIKETSDDQIKALRDEEAKTRQALEAVRRELAKLAA